MVGEGAAVYLWGWSTQPYGCGSEFDWGELQAEQLRRRSLDVSHVSLRKPVWWMGPPMRVAALWFSMACLNSGKISLAAVR